MVGSEPRQRAGNFSIRIRVRPSKNPGREERYELHAQAREGWSARRESNPHDRFRRARSYPLNDGRKVYLK